MCIRGYMENVVFNPEDIENFRKFRQNFEYASGLFSELKKHIGEYVVISNSQVLEYSKDKEYLTKKYAHLNDVLIELITDSSIPWIL